GTGMVTDNQTGSARAIALQEDGKLLVLGARTLTRYASDGTIDPSFGTNGTITIAFAGGANVESQDLAVQPEGRILVAGYTGALFGGQTDFAVSRYGADGSLDTSFGVNGTVVSDWNGGVDRAYAVELQSDGKIVVAGHAAVASTGTSSNDY